MLRKPLAIMALVALAVVCNQNYAAAQPDTVWTRWYGGASDEEAYSIQQTTDGGFIITGYTATFGAGGKDVWLLKIDSGGDTLWTRTYGGIQDDIGRSVRQTSDGGYIIVGQTNSFGGGNADLWLIKTDADGDSLWAKTYGGSANDVGNSIRQTEDGGYIIAGTNASFSAYYDDVWLLKTDSAGDTLWTKSWDVSSNDDRGTEVQQTYDGGFVVVGHSYYAVGGHTLDFTLFKTDSQGDTLWMEIYGERVDQRGASVDQTSDNGYVLTGYTAHSGMTNPDVYVVKTDSGGDTTWTRTYGGSSWEEGYLVRQTTEGGYFIAGKTNSFGAGGFDVWVLEMDSNGDTLWTRAYGGTSDDVAYSGQQTADEGYIITGYTESFGTGGKDVFLIRLAGRSPRIVSISPTQNELNVSLSTNISVTFDLDMDETTINDSTFVVNARSTGLHQGTIAYDAPSRTATFDPAKDFAEGEVVMVTLTTHIRSSGSIPLDSAFVWCFTLLVYDGWGSFGSDSVYAVGDCPVSVFSGDLDGDGHMDLAVANNNHDNVSILLNNGDGTFGPQSVYSAGGSPLSMFSADLDGDGDLDLTTANTSNVSVLLNNGEGNFTFQSVYTVGYKPRSVFSADLDGDGDMDLATANSNSNDISVLLNNGDATFAPHLVYAVGIYPNSILSADLDSDGDLDLVNTNAGSDNVSVFLNNGNATFAAQSVCAVGDGPSSVFSADLDGDGDMDLTTVNSNSNNVSVLLNNGDGTFASHCIYPVGVDPRSVFSADLDGDGDLDLAVANTYSHNVSVLLNNGNGAFTPHSVYPAGDFPNSVFSADLDGDGDLDLAISNHSSDDISVLLNEPKPHVAYTLPARNELNVPVSTDISVTFDVDMDETSINDSTFVVNARSTGLHQGAITYDNLTKTAAFDPAQDFDAGEVITVALTTGIKSSSGIALDSAYAWSFTSLVYDGPGIFLVDSVYALSCNPRSVFSADLDGDGDLDLAVANFSTPNISVLMNNGDGSFALDSAYPVGDFPISVFSADLDGDGDLDLMTANSMSDNVSVLLNNGDGTFAAQCVYSVGDYPNSVFSADLDGDGDLDLMTANSMSDNVSVLLNNGDGTFAPQSVYAVGDFPLSVFSADLDDDGDLDLATANRWSDNVSVILNNGDATFDPHSVHPVGDDPFSLFSADLDGDGDLDLTTADHYSDSVSVLLNYGDGTFAARSVYAAGDGPYSVFSADLDGDGDQDMATANYFSDNVSVLRNNGDGTFAPQSVYTAGDGPVSVFSADLDGDGDLDLATANYYSRNVSVLRNCLDSDEDWVCDESDNCPTTYNPQQEDSDEDAAGDSCDNCLSHYNPEQEDTDEDDAGDSCDVCPFVYNPDQEDADGDGHGDSCDNCLAHYNPDQENADGDSYGDSCDICPHHAQDDCCNPVGSNVAPEVTSDAEDTVMPSPDPYVYIATASDENCDGTELEINFFDVPSWCSVLGDTLFGLVACDAVDTSFKVTVSDGDLADTLAVTLLIDHSNVAPTIESPGDTVLACAGDTFAYYPTIVDPDDTVHSVDYLTYPPWCSVQDDSLIGIVPGSAAIETLTVSAQDYCNADTVSFLVRTYVSGDANGDGVIDLGDAIYLLNYLFKNDDPPDPLEAGDANCDGKVEIGDAIYLLNYLFKNGPPPGCP